MRGEPAAPDCLRGYRVFWLISLAGLVAAFVAVGFWDPTQAHYLMPCYFAAGALIGSWFRPGMRRSSSSSSRRSRLAQLVALPLALTAFAAHTAYSTAALNPALTHGLAPSAR